MRYQPRVVRSPAAHTPGVRSGRSCHMQPTRPWESPVRPAVGFGRSSHTRLQQLASRSASGRVLSPPYAAARPNARSTGARGQRASRPASGAHPTRGRPVCCRHAPVRVRPVHQPARASKAPPQRLPGCHRTSPATVSEPLHQQPTPSSARQKPSQSRDSPSCDPRTRQLHRERLRAPGSPPDATCHPGRRPSRYNCSCNRPPKARRAPWPCPPP